MSTITLDQSMKHKLGSREIACKQGSVNYTRRAHSALISHTFTCRSLPTVAILAPISLMQHATTPRPATSNDEANGVWLQQH